MTHMIIKSNTGTTANVLIPDMGFLVPFGGGQETVAHADMKRAQYSDDLRRLTTDDAYNPAGSTLILNDGTNDIAADDAEGYLDTVLARSEDPTFDATPKFNRGYGVFQSNASYIQNNSTSYAEVTTFPWVGTDLLAVYPTIAYLILSAASAGSNISFRITDITNALVVLEQSVLVSDVADLYTLSPLANLSAGAAVWSVEIKKNTNGDGAARLHFVNVR